MRLYSALASVLLLGACAATHPPSADELHPAPAQQVESMPVAKSATPATVRVARDVGYIGSAVFMHVSLDGKKIAALNPGEFIEFRVDPGEYLLSAIPTNIFNERHPTVIEVTWRAGTTYRYRVGMDANMSVNILRDLPGYAPPPKRSGNASNNACAYGAGPCR